MLGLLSYIVCMCYIDDRIFLFAQICQGSDSSVYLFVCFLAILSPIHFFSKCSPYLDGLVEHPPGFPHSFLRITTALTQVSNEIHLGEFPHQLAHTVHLCAMLVQTQDSLLLQPASFMQGLCELTLLKIWGNSVRSTITEIQKTSSQISDIHALQSSRGPLHHWEQSPWVYYPMHHRSLALFHWLVFPSLPHIFPPCGTSYFSHSILQNNLALSISFPKHSFRAIFAHTKLSRCPAEQKY